MQEPRHLRVFISSPSDVAAERAIARSILARLPYDPFLRGRITIEIVAWDGPVASVPMMVAMTPQEAITRGLARPSECDIVIVILWRRLGTPLPDAYRRPDGTRYESGTEWEYEDALLASRQPLIMLYRRTSGTGIDSSEPDPIQTQLQGELVKRFFDAFQNADGSARGGVNTYSNPEEFGNQLDFHLREMLSRVVAANILPAEFLVQPMRLDAATPRQSVLGRSTQVRVQVCLPSSEGQLRNTARKDSEETSEQIRDGLMPIMFRKEKTSGAPAATPVAVDLFTPSHFPVHSTEDLLLLPSHDSGVVSFSIEPRQTGIATIRVALRQRLYGDQPVTSGTVVLESTIVRVGPEAEDDDMWQVVSRLLGTTTQVPGSLPHTAASTHAPQARLTVKIVEDRERRKIEKYLTLEIPFLYSLLPVLRNDGKNSLFNPTGQKAAGTKLFEEMKQTLVERLRHDDELFAFLRDHPNVTGIDLVLLIEDRIAPVVRDHSPRVFATIITKIGLYEFVGAALPHEARESNQL